MNVFPVACVVAAAGAGRRFGGPKAAALLPDGRRFIDAVCATARDAGLSPVVAVLPPNIEAPAGVIGVANPKPEGEQVTSIRIGLSRLANSACIGAVVWPVDHPFVSLETVLAVVDAAQRTSAPIVAPRLGGDRGHPVFFHRDTWRELMTVEDGGARAVVRAYGDRVAVVDVRDAGVRRNIDTPADLQGG